MEILNEIEKDLIADEIDAEFLQDVSLNLKKAENTEWVAKETLVVIVEADGKISPFFEICGKKMIDWVALSTSGCQQKIIKQPQDDDILNAVSKFADDFNFVAVFYSDTPLLKKSTFLEIMDFFSKNRMNVLRLSRGYVFRAEFLQSAKIILSSSFEEFDKEDFLVVSDAQKLGLAFNILNQRILSYHKQNGVIFFGENTIFVDADVEIESGSVIYPNNVIKGESYIGKNVILESGNYIFDTIVCDDAFVCQSYLEKSKIEKGKLIGPFEKIINQKV